MNNKQLAERIMGWSWVVDDSWRNWWHDKLGARTEYGSSSMHLNPENAFKPHQRLHDAFELLFYLENTHFEPEWELKSSKPLLSDPTIEYRCTIYAYGYDNNNITCSSHWCTSPQEAICVAVSEFAEDSGGL
jgi:hypothetical protein